MSDAPVPRWARWAVGGIACAFAAVLAVLSVLRHNGFWTARYDLGNMTQAVWSASRGDLFTVTDPAGLQISRLGGHVDPILGLFGPLWRIWPDERMLLVVQALAVASMAIPAFLLARRWIGDDRIAVVFAGVSLAYPAVQWATLFDFHPVTLAAPLLLWCIWAAASGHDVTLALLAVAAALTKEQVGLSLAILGLWMAVSLGRRRAGGLLALWGLGWTAVAVGLIIPRHSPTGGSQLLEERYGDLGGSAGEVLLALVTRPWDAIEIMFSPERGAYVLALLLPLLCLSLLAPLLAAGALPDLLLNLLSSRLGQHSIEYHYSAVIAPFLIAAAIRGLARLRAERTPAPIRDIARSWRAVAVGLVGGAVVSGYLLGPMPFWQYVPGGSRVRAEQYRNPAHVAALRAAVAAIPPHAVVSAGNRIGGHLSARRRILAFPLIADAEYVVVDLNRPDLVDGVNPVLHRRYVAALRARPDFVVVSERDGVIVFRRRAPA